MEARPPPEQGAVPPTRFDHGGGHPPDQGERPRRPLPRQAEPMIMSWDDRLACSLSDPEEVGDGLVKQA